MAHFVITCAYLTGSDLKGTDLTGCGTSRPNQPLFAQKILLSGFICCGEKIM
jgi:hypothetical protein